MDAYKRYELEWSVPELRIWLVDGKMVRETLDLEFIGGGHDQVYPHFVPANEIWLDSSTSPDELIYVVLHEVYERWLMRNDLDYNTAHEFANKLEKLMRDKGDICLTSKIIQTFVKKNIEANQEPREVCVQLVIE